MNIKEMLIKALTHKSNNTILSSFERNSDGSMLFRDYFINYLVSMDGEIRSRSFSITITLASHILNGLGCYKMNEINKDVLKKFINGFSKQKYLKSPKTLEYEYYSQSTINKVYNLLHGAIKEAAGEDGNRLLQMDYMANIKKPRSKKKNKQEYLALTDKEIRILLYAVRCNQMIYVWICLMLYTGVRPSEALALKWSDINYKESTISISRALSQEDFYDAKHLKKVKPSIPIITDLKNERENDSFNWQKRTLKVAKRLLQVLWDWENTVKSNTSLMKKKRKSGTESLLFCGSQGQLWLYEYYSEAYERLLAKNGLKYSDYNPYRFRHNYCTRLFRTNVVNIKAAQLIMGDNTPTMVMKVYANLDKSDVLKGSEDLSKSMDQIFTMAQSDNKSISDLFFETN